jgi:hypothetical protein
MIRNTRCFAIHTRIFPTRANMFWLVLEAVVALAILIVIVWWTWPRPPRDDTGRGRRD